MNLVLYSRRRQHASGFEALTIADSRVAALAIGGLFNAILILANILHVPCMHGDVPLIEDLSLVDKCVLEMTSRPLGGL
jgi:hypothetical protein